MEKVLENHGKIEDARRKLKIFKVELAHYFHVNYGSDLNDLKFTEIEQFMADNDLRGSSNYYFINRYVIGEKRTSIPWGALLGDLFG